MTSSAIKNYLSFEAVILEEILRALEEETDSPRKKVFSTVLQDIKTQLNGTSDRKDYKFCDEENSYIKEIKAEIDSHAQNLIEEEPNKLEDKILKSCAQVNQSAKITFKGDGSLIDLHIALFKGDQTAQYAEHIEKHREAILSCLKQLEGPQQIVQE